MKNANKDTNQSSTKQSFFDIVYTVVKSIPCGKVATYGDIAKLCGNSRASRQVGWALHSNPYFGVVPCHRVVNRFGQLAQAFVFGGEQVQADMLFKEGVSVVDNKVDLSIYRWQVV